jgi:CSLREA domain-containing protein
LRLHERTDDRPTPSPPTPCATADPLSIRRVALLLAALPALALALLLAPGAHADVDAITVTSKADPGDGDCLTNGCTLREAITRADDGDPANDADRVLFESGLSGTITLNGNELPLIDEPLTIQAPRASTLAVSGNDQSRILNINTADGHDVTVSGLTLRRGFGFGNGGAIQSHDADLTIRSSTISDSENVECCGGGVYSRSGTVAVESSTISGNSTIGADFHVGGGAGGLVALGDPHGGSTTIRDSTISGNSTWGAAGAASGAAVGGVSATGGTTTIQRSTISGNSATIGEVSEAGGAGGIYFFDTVGVETRTIRNSTISGNSGKGSGGGIVSGSSGGDTTTIESSTISGNSTRGRGGGVLAAGGGTLTIRSSTISGNSAEGADASGGGVYSAQVPFNPTLGNTILANTVVANNSAALVGPDLASSRPSIDFETAFSVIEDPSQASIDTMVAGSNIIGVDPRLGPLEPNGGPTQTHAPAADSPAVDKGSSAFASDQRGLLRRVNRSATDSVAAGANCADIGAFELQLTGGGAGPPCTAGPPSPPSPGPLPSNDFSFGKVNRNKKKGTAKLTVKVPGPGELELAKTKQLKSRQKRADAAGKEKLKLKPRLRAKKRLDERGKVRINAKVTYTPDGGKPNTQSKRIKLIKRR